MREEEEDEEKGEEEEDMGLRLKNPGTYVNGLFLSLSFRSPFLFLLLLPPFIRRM